MKRMCLLCCFLFLAFSAWLVSSLFSPPVPTESLIKPGMTLPEVQRILGRPSSGYFEKYSQIYVYGDYWVYFVCDRDDLLPRVESIRKVKSRKYFFF
jgi:hypothetical protein